MQVSKRTNLALLVVVSVIWGVCWAVIGVSTPVALLVAVAIGVLWSIVVTPLIGGAA